MKSFFNNLSCFFIFFFFSILFPSVKKTIIEQNNTKIIIDLDFDAVSEADLYPTSLLLGLPEKKMPVTNIQYYERSEIPFKSIHEPISGYNWTNFQKLKNLYRKYLGLDLKIIAYMVLPIYWATMILAPFLQ